MDKLTVLQKLAFGNESSAKIFKAFADPPTTSLQRLKGLTTGGLPTFVDVGNSFGAPAIVEDNFINQVVFFIAYSLNLKCVFSFFKSQLCWLLSIYIASAKWETVGDDGR